MQHSTGASLHATAVCRSRAGKCQGPVHVRNAKGVRWLEHTVAEADQQRRPMYASRGAVMGVGWVECRPRSSGLITGSHRGAAYAAANQSPTLHVLGVEGIAQTRPVWLANIAMGSCALLWTLEASLHLEGYVS
jgi:hypothetical protein